MKSIIASLITFLFTSIALAGTCENMVVDKIFPTTTEAVTIICHKRFVIGYSTVRKAPLWVAEVLTADMIRANDDQPRKDHFRLDDSIPSEAGRFWTPSDSPRGALHIRILE